MKHSIMRRFTSIFQTQDTNPNRIQTMEGLRGLAVTLVFLVHYNTLFSAWLEPNSATWHSAKFITSIGRIGVDLFLAITGYLIYGAVIKCILHYHLFFLAKANYRNQSSEKSRTSYKTFFCCLVYSQSNQ